MMASQSLSGIRILLTNDDGIHAPGMKVLEKIANALSPDVWVVAPEKEQSGKGCSSTFDSVLRIQEWSPRRFSVTGTPADNFFMAVDRILCDKKPDLLLSGINYGSNLGNYLSLSGTLGAAFAGASQHIRSIAISQHFESSSKAPKFSLAEHLLPGIIKKLYNMAWRDKRVINVNIPDCQLKDVAGIKVVKQADVEVCWSSIEILDPNKKKCYWMTSNFDIENSVITDTDICALENKYVSITPLYNDFTDYESMDDLREVFYGS